MAGPRSQIFSPVNFQDLFSAWKSFPGAVLCAGGAELIRSQARQLPDLPPNVISLDKLDDLKKISRTERYLEIGAMVRLNQIIHMGKIVPEALIRCLENIAEPKLRNLITIGGNICNFSRRMDCSGPMIALDAQFELRTAQSSRWLAASRFSSLPGPPDLAPQEILTRIRVPLEPWTFTWYRKFNIPCSNEPGGNILFMIMTEKDILTKIRVVYSGKTILREKNDETMLSGKHLPLDRRDAEAFLDRWKTYLSVFETNDNSIFPGEGENFNPELAKAQILNFIESTLTHITD